MNAANTVYRPGANPNARQRVKHGRVRENQIAEALRVQHHLPIKDATEHEDKMRKVDRWIHYPDQPPVALQIKFRETGSDLLFEVYDKFFGWNDPKNKLGRDMFGDAKEYGVLLDDRKTVVMAPTKDAKAIITEMLEYVQQYGWTRDGYTKTLEYKVGRYRLNLKMQRDPADDRVKMVAYIPAGYFIDMAQAKSYQVALPQEW